MVEDLSGVNFWLHIPAKVAAISNSSLNSTSKLIFGEIYSLLNAVDKFYMNNKNLGKRVGIKERQVSRSVTKLKKLGLINVKIVYKNGVPKRLVSLPKGAPYMTRGYRHQRRGGTVTDDYKENNRENKNSESSSKEQDPDVQEKAKAVIDMLNHKAAKNFHYSKTSMKYIKARIREKYSNKEFAYVIMNKVAEWKDTRFDKFLRPQTLFTEQHMDDYLNEKQIFSNNSNQGRKDSSKKKQKSTKQVQKEREQDELKTERIIKAKLKGDHANE